MQLINKFSSLILVSLLLITAACGNSESESSNASEETSSNQQQTINQAAPTQKLNLNTTPEDEFMSIPNVGENMAHEFEEYRPYTSINQFRKEISKYVDMDQVTAYEQYVFVPIDPNECDAATLQQIPGLEESEAQELINARPFDNNDAFVQELSNYVDEEQLNTAKSYLVSQ